MDAAGSSGSKRRRTVDENVSVVRWGGPPMTVRTGWRRFVERPRPARFYSSIRSNTTTLRSLSALMIFLFGGLTPERTMLIDDGATPFSFLPTLVGFPLGLLPNEASELPPFDLAHACLFGPASVERCI